MMMDIRIDFPIFRKKKNRKRFISSTSITETKGHSTRVSMTTQETKRLIVEEIVQEGSVSN